MQKFVMIFIVLLLGIVFVPTFGQEDELDKGETIYFTTGDYDCKRDWDAIIRLKDFGDGGILQEDGVIPIRRITDENGVYLNFIHSIYVDENRDEMFVASIFTGIDYLSQKDTDCTGFADYAALEAGSVGVLSNISTADGPQVLARHIYGDKTGLRQPHGIWVDEKTERLYIANTYLDNILVYENAFSVSGNVAPDHVITSPAMRYPAYIYVDSETDRMFVANYSAINQGSEFVPDDGSRASVLIFDNASTLDGEVLPTARIVDDGEGHDETGLTNGFIHITHNVWYDAATNLIFVVHHTEEILIYDIATMTTACSDVYNCELQPKTILTIGKENRLTSLHSVYGVMYDSELDRLYVTVGFTDFTGVIDFATGEITPKDITVDGFPPNGIYIFDGVSELEGDVNLDPTLFLGWESGVTPHLVPETGTEERYFPPQPIWVSRPQ